MDNIQITLGESLTFGLLASKTTHTTTLATVHLRKR
jgi:hypothetical protein